MEYDLLLLHLDRGFIPTPIDPVGQLSISSYIKPHGFRAKTWAGSAGAVKPVLEKELGRGAAPVVGLYANADNLSIVHNIIPFLKGYGVTVVVGGPQAIALEEADLRRLGCDYCIDGEAEIPTLRLLRFLRDGTGGLGEIAGLRYIDQNGLYQAGPPQGEFVQNLDEIGFAGPEDLLTPAYKTRPWADMMTGRGCPFHCTFCYEGANAKRVRNRSVENVLAEIDHIRGYNPGLAGVIFGDDTFTLEEERLRALCNGIRQRGLAFFCEGHAHILCQKPHLIDYMVECGLAAMQIGIESGSPKVLAAYNKNTTPDGMEAVVRRARAAGLISLQGNFILGGAFEDENTLAESMALCRRLLEAGRGMMICSTVYFAPYPHTPITRAPEDFGLAIHPELEACTLSTMFSCVTSTPALTADEITEHRRVFDAFIDEQYTLGAQSLTAGDLENRCTKPGLFARFNPIWDMYQMKQPHIARFIQNGWGNCEARPEAVVLRSFPELRYDASGALLCAGRAFTGPEKRFLELACGGHTLAALAEEIGLGFGQAAEMLRRMYDSCLAYTSPF